MSKKQLLLELAAEKVRQGGYQHFSFRELAEATGIKSASVHYHFATKEELGAELARLYTEDFLRKLGEPGLLVQQAIDPVAHYAQHFKTSLIEDEKMCLCGLLGAQKACLPDKVQLETRQFFEKNTQWLEQAYRAKAPLLSQEQCYHNALFTLSLLQGALLVCGNLDDTKSFDKVLEQLT